MGSLGFGITQDTAQFVKGTDQVKKGLEKTVPAAKKATTFLDLFKARLRDSATHAGAFGKAMQKLNSSVARIAFYRMIRSGLKAVTAAFREGISNLYQYSEALNSLDAARAKYTMDEFATTALYVKNSLGAALMPILQSLLPIVNAIADAFVWAANAINEFWSALQGKSFFTKAKRYATEFGDALAGAAGHAKELKKQIFGFDELNIFNEPSGGGGGGANGLDYSQMFEESEIDGIFARIRDRIQQNLGADFAARFKMNFKDIIFNWKNLNAEQVAEKMLTGFYGLMGGLAGFAIAGPIGAVVGTLSGVALGVYFSTIDFNGDGHLQVNEVLSMILDVAATLTGAIVGWELGGPMGAMVGMTIGAGLTAAVKTFAPSPGMGECGILFVGLLLGVVKTLVKHPGLVFSAAGGTGLAIGMVAAASLGITIASLLELKKDISDQTRFITICIVEIMNLAVGAGIGFAIGGPAGALIGITIACGLNLLINAVGFNFTPESKRQMDKFGTIDQANMDAYMEFGTPNYDSGNASLNRARGRANGGFVEAGTYFYAGESGPELVGQVGGRTHVTNQDQFTAGMEGIMDNTNTVILQAAQALIQAIQSKDMNPVVQISDRAIVNAYDRGKTLAGGSLVV